jgi:membrane protein involved in colicin uptake
MNKQLMTAGLALALGLVWTAGPALAQTTGEKIEGKAEKAADKAEDKAERAKDKAEAKADRAEDKADSKMDKVKDKAVELKDKAKDKTTELKDKTKAKMDKAGDKMEARADKSDVSAMQQALKDKGHDPGPIDGIFGPRTRAALRDYQTKEGLTATGRWDDATRAKLGVTTSATTTTTTGGSASPATSPGGSQPLTGDTKGGASAPSNMPAQPERDKQPAPKRQNP